MNKHVLKLYFILLLLGSSVGFVKGQSNGCNCIPIYSDWMSTYYVVQAANPPTIPEETVISIRYREFICGTTKIILWNHGVGFGPGFDCVPNPLSVPCNSPFNFQDEYKNAVNSLMGSGSAGYTLSLVLSEVCKSLASVQYPQQDTCYYFHPEGPNQGQISGKIVLGLGLAQLDCNSNNCCSYDYIWNASTLKWQYTSKSPDVTCPPFPTILTDTIFCQDQNNLPTFHVGNVMAHDSCKSYCTTPLPEVTTASTDKPISFPDVFDLNVSPIPATDYVNFSSTENIEKIEIYDITGKKLKEQKNFPSANIDIKDIPNGVFFIRVYFANLSVRSLKIIKN